MVIEELATVYITYFVIGSGLGSGLYLIFLLLSGGITKALKLFNII